MINATPSISSTPNMNTGMPTAMPPQPTPAVNNAPTPGQPKKDNGLASKFTPKAIIGLVILLLIVVGSGFALYVSQKATQQAGVADPRSQAAPGGIICSGLQTKAECELVPTKCEWKNTIPAHCTGTAEFCKATKSEAACNVFNDPNSCYSNDCIWSSTGCHQQNCSLGSQSTCEARNGCAWRTCEDVSALECSMYSGCSVVPEVPGGCFEIEGDPEPEFCEVQPDASQLCVGNNPIGMCYPGGVDNQYACYALRGEWAVELTDQNNPNCVCEGPYDGNNGVPRMEYGKYWCFNTASAGQCTPDTVTIGQYGYPNNSGQHVGEQYWTGEMCSLEPQSCGPTPTPPGGGGGGPACDDLCTSNAECQETNSNWMCTAVVAGNISFEAASPWSGPIALGNSPTSGPWESQAELVINNGTTLYQTIRKGNLGYARTVPIKADGYPDWTASSAWSGPYTHTGLPASSGAVQALSYLLLPTQPERTVMIALWMNNQGYIKTIPMLANGSIDFTRASEWSAPVAYSALPCDAGGNVEATADILVGTTVRQNLWCAGEGYVRTAPLAADGNVNWSAATAWSPATTADASGFPGTGTVRTNSLVLLPNNYVLQSLWRGSDTGMTGWTREVPVGRRCRVATNPGSKMCTPTAPPPSPSPTPSPVACSWLQVVTPNTPNLMPGQSALIGSAATSPVNNFFYAVYNKDNLYTNGTPKPVCVTTGGDITITDANGDQCPGESIHHLIFKNSNTQLRSESGNISRTYEQIFLNDANWNNQKLVHAQINAYVSVGTDPWSAPVASCVKSATAVPGPTPSPSPTPLVSPSPTPLVSPSPTPAGPMCLSITMSKVGGAGNNIDAAITNYIPAIGDSVNFTCGQVTGAMRYEFRVMQPNGELVSLAATGRTSSVYTIPTYGRFYAQCRFCLTASGACDQAWEALPGITPSPMPSPTFSTNPPSPAPTTDPKASPSPFIQPPPTTDPKASPSPFIQPPPTLPPSRDSQ